MVEHFQNVSYMKTEDDGKQFYEGLAAGFGHRALIRTIRLLSNESLLQDFGFDLDPKNFSFVQGVRAVLCGQVCFAARNCKEKTSHTKCQLAGPKQSNVNKPARKHSRITSKSRPKSTAKQHQ